MTVILTFVGMIVFLFSIFTVGFKAGFWRLVGFAITGVILDVLIGCVTALFVYNVL